MVRSILLYTPAALAIFQGRKEINLVYQLMVLSVCGTFRITSNEIVLVVAGMMLINIMLIEMNVLYR